MASRTRNFSGVPITFRGELLHHEPVLRRLVGANPKAVRAWAASNGIQVNTRGRIPADVVQKFEATNAA